GLLTLGSKYTSAYCAAATTVACVSMCPRPSSEALSSSLARLSWCSRCCVSDDELNARLPKGEERRGVSRRPLSLASPRRVKHKNMNKLTAPHQAPSWCVVAGRA